MREDKETLNEFSHFFSREHIKLSYALPELGNITRHRSLQML